MQVVRSCSWLQCNVPSFPTLWILQSAWYLCRERGLRGCRGSVRWLAVILIAESGSLPLLFVNVFSAAGTSLPLQPLLSCCRHFSSTAGISLSLRPLVSRSNHYSLVVTECVMLLRLLFCCSDCHTASRNTVQLLSLLLLLLLLLGLQPPLRLLCYYSLCCNAALIALTLLLLLWRCSDCCGAARTAVMLLLQLWRCSVCCGGARTAVALLRLL